MSLSASHRTSSASRFAGLSLAALMLAWTGREAGAQQARQLPPGEIPPIAAVIPGVPLASTVQPGALSRRSPPRASRPVQPPALRGTIQRPIRPEPRAVATMPFRALPAPVPVRPSPVILRRRQQADPDPYAPLGLRLGSVILRPAITSSFGYDTNPQRVAGSGQAREGSTFQRYDAELDVQSDWNVHELSGRIRGGYLDYFRNREASRPDGEGNLNLRLDANRDTRILLETRGRLDTQRPGSPDLNAPVVGRPEVWQYGGSAGVTHDINRLQLTLRGSVDRSDYEDARLRSGAILSQRDRNQTQYAIRARAAYELTPGLRPFIQADADERIFDESVDSSGYRRSSQGLGARVGSTFELTRLITGEVSVGYQDRDYRDGRLKNLRGIVGDAAILWTPTPLTTVTLRGTSELGDTTIAGSSGTRVHRGTLEVAHALRRNVTVTGFGSFGRTDYDGQNLREDFATIGARVDYKLTRTVVIRASFTHERLNSTTPGSDFTANVAQVGLRLQF